ncbi:unnamed protein product [Polarella glacialis]|uniref:Enoyl-CoA hydratase/isomerase domain-containing protein n=1 Tax=Polarella glacialis TaxID=89957 RepID=A0A813HUF6_POLGL|nr:unnamed protein product [Polarella glacialis]
MGKQLPLTSEQSQKKLNSRLQILIPGLQIAQAPDLLTVRSRLRLLSEEESARAELRRWAADRLEGLERGCPVAQEVSLRLLRIAESLHRRRPTPESRHQNLMDALERDYAVTLRLLRRPDFIEGVRATLVDKDGKPHWRSDNVAMRPLSVKQLVKDRALGVCIVTGQREQVPEKACCTRSRATARRQPSPTRKPGPKELQGHSLLGCRAKETSHGWKTESSMGYVK